MKTLKTSRTLTTVISRLSVYVYLAYIFITFMAKATTLSPFSTDDMIVMLLLGTVVGIFCLASFSLRMLYYMLRKSTYRHS